MQTTTSPPNPTLKGYNPDVLSCLASLSNDEVFTPPGLANQMLDLLPAALWSNPEARFLDPFCKSGVFLREMARRLLVGLEPVIPDLQTRINHIFTKQLYGIAITELTAYLSRRSVYCAKRANGTFSVVSEGFADEAGNIRYNTTPHTWDKQGRCTFCGANQEAYDRAGMESYAFTFIHTHKPEEIFNMKFDVIVGNPPYQISDGGGAGTSAMPVYHKFVKKAIELSPKYVLMIIPSRWFSGGKGLDEFRNEMLNDRSIRVLVDFENAAEVFPGVDIAGGVCYFLWDRDYSGDCRVINLNQGNAIESVRPLNQYDIFIRNSQSINIIEKVLRSKIGKGTFLNSRVLSRRPFGLGSDVKNENSGTPCWFTQKIGKRFVDKSLVTDNFKVLDKWKLLVPKAPIAGQTDFSKPIAFYYESNMVIASPGECCTESWLVLGAFKSKDQVINFKSYVLTKLFRFLLLQTVISQNTSRKNFAFIPDFLDYNHKFDDKELIKLFDISATEWSYIASKIKS